MKFVASLLLLLSIGHVAGAGQRLLDMRPGVQCDGIEEVERLLGSVAVAVDEPVGVSQYAGTHGGLDATIIYVCENGLLAEQKVIVRTVTREAAYRFTNEQKAELVQRLGSPAHDGLDLDIWSRLAYGFKGSDLDYLSEVIVWGKAKEDVMLSVRQKEENLWEITISQGMPKLEYILNL